MFTRSVCCREELLDIAFVLVFCGLPHQLGSYGFYYAGLGCDLLLLLTCIEYELEKGFYLVWKFWNDTLFALAGEKFFIITRSHHL